MITATDIKYEEINGNRNVYRVKLKEKKIGYVHNQNGLWIFTPADGGQHTIGQTRTIAVAKSLIKE